MEKLRGVGRAAHALLLLAVLVGSAAFTVALGWRNLVGAVPACQDERGLVTCITSEQPRGLSWYGTAFAMGLWLAMLRWSATSLALRIAARTVITLGTGMSVAELTRGPRDRALPCYSSGHGECLRYFPSLTLTQAALGLLVGAAVAFALVPPRLVSARAGRTLAPV
jgi:hypothetical protein